MSQFFPSETPVHQISPSRTSQQPGFTSQSVKSLPLKMGVKSSSAHRNEEAETIRMERAVARCFIEIIKRPTISLKQERSKLRKAVAPDGPGVTSGGEGPVKADPGSIKSSREALVLSKKEIIFSDCNPKEFELIVGFFG